MSPESNAKQIRVIEGAGVANPHRRALVPSRPEEGALDAATIVDAVENPVGGLPIPMPEGGPYVVKNGAARLFHAVKRAWHAHDRMEERTPFHRSHVDYVQHAVDTLNLPGDAYHLPLRAKDGGVAGYAQFKRVPNRKGPVLATVLAPYMKPSGQNIESMLKQGSEPETNADVSTSNKFTTDHIDPRPPESRAWNRVHRHPNQETAAYALRQAFNNATRGARHEVIEDGHAPSEIPDVT
jgi:hypothetical protein